VPSWLESIWVLTMWVTGKLRPRALLMTRSNTAQQTLRLQRYRWATVEMASPRALERS